jgi:hypothetical protein
VLLHEHGFRAIAVHIEEPVEPLDPYVVCRSEVLLGIALRQPVALIDTLLRLVAKRDYWPTSLDETCSFLAADVHASTCVEGCPSCRGTVLPVSQLATRHLRLVFLCGHDDGFSREGVRVSVAIELGEGGKIGVIQRLEHAPLEGGESGFRDAGAGADGSCR